MHRTLPTPCKEPWGQAPAPPKLSAVAVRVEHMFEYDGRPPVGRLGGALDQLAGEELAGLPVGALGEDVVALGIARNRLEAEFARRLVAFDRGGGAAAAGAASTAAWLRHRARLAPGAAAAWVRTARRLADDLTALSLIHISEPTRQAEISYAVFCL